jgi:hypothetical protein
MASDVDDAVLDGNAVAGLLASTFGGDMTAIPARCAHCQTVSMIARMQAYTRAPGTVLRCPVCAQVVLRIVETPTAVLVDATGAAWLRMERR